MRERLLGPEHPAVCTSLNNLAALLNSLGQAEEAVAMIRLSLARTEAVLGASHPSVATLINNLAVIIVTIGHFLV
jgi:hypothetical protein